MQSRRTLLLSVVSGMVALAVVVAPAIADELFGVITKVDVPAKKITVLEKGSGNEVLVTITDDTKLVTPKGEGKADLEKIAKGVAKAQESGRKGMMAKITHEKGVASKITAVAKKKVEANP